MSNVIPFPEFAGCEFAVPIRHVPKVILSGLRSAGVKADHAKVWRGGKFAHTLDLVIDMDCPWSHASRDGMTFAKVRLLVDPRKGTLTVQSDEEMGNGCPHCDQKAIDRWLVTCQGHEENGHPDHEPGWIVVEDFPDDASDEEILHVLGATAEARGWARADDSPMGRIWAAMEKAEAEQAQSVTLQVGSTELVLENWTEETVAAWLAEQGVSPTMGQNAAWATVKDVPGCPSQTLVRRAQATRKSGG